ncbi:MAG TPA: 3-dehydroquinate synthase [Ardenticatenaceae bacterium]
MNSALVITGFMGTGKTLVGRLVAQRLDRPFLDLDELVEEVSGRSIPTLFAEGEEEFRWWEQNVLGKLDLAQHIVLATGGGTLVGAWNQGRTTNTMTVVLDAPLDVVRARVVEGSGRPLAPNLDALYERRAAAYTRLPIHVQAANRTPEEVAEEIVALSRQWQPTSQPSGGGETLEVRAPGGANYSIHVQAGVAAGIGGFAGRYAPGGIALVTDSVVGPLWGETVRHDLLAARLRATLVEIPAGEAHKTLDTLSTIYDQLLDAGVDRGGAVVALGGGVVGDLAGFTAATWMRGVRSFIQVPTTVLSMVDASIGGKTGVDHPRGKNLIGAFRHPDLVLVDPVFLQTLPLRELRGGLAEVIKHGIIADPGLLDEVARLELEQEIAPTVWEPLLARALRVKAEIVERDPYEQGERAKLNLGHTFGHAYELLSGFALSHGEAVSVGMVTAARLSEVLGLAQEGLATCVEQTLSGVGLPIRWPAANAEAVWQTMQSDKKKGSQGLRFVLPRALGDVVVTASGEVDEATVRAVIEAQNRA